MVAANENYVDCDERAARDARDIGRRNARREEEAEDLNGRLRVSSPLLLDSGEKKEKGPDA